MQYSDVVRGCSLHPFSVSAEKSGVKACLSNIRGDRPPPLTPSSICKVTSSERSETTMFSLRVRCVGRAESWNGSGRSDVAEYLGRLPSKLASITIDETTCTIRDLSMQLWSLTDVHPSGVQSGPNHLRSIPSQLPSRLTWPPHVSLLSSSPVLLLLSKWFLLQSGSEARH